MSYEQKIHSVFVRNKIVYAAIAIEMLGVSYSGFWGSLSKRDGSSLYRLNRVRIQKEFLVSPLLCRNESVTKLTFSLYLPL